MIELTNLLMKMVIITNAGLISPLNSFTHYNYAVDNSHGFSSYLSYLKNAYYYKQSSPNADELGEYMEGDIVLPNMEDFEMKEKPVLWQDRTVPYTISSEFYEHPEALNLIYDAMKDFQHKTCIRFVQRTTEPDFIQIRANGRGCWSYVGKQGGLQIVNLQIPVCVRKIGTVIHEFMHAIGFFHEHRRNERDYYIEVVWGNIKREARMHFDRLLPPEENLGTEYDYGSVMHYSMYAFSKNKEPTILPKLSTDKILGQRYGFSDSDIKKVNMKYKCFPFGWR